MVEQGMVWYDSGKSGMISGVLQDELMDSSSTIWALCPGYQIMSSLLWALCVPDIKSRALWYELSVSRISNHELFGMSSLYHVSQIMSSLVWGLCITDHEYRIMSSMILLATRCVSWSQGPRVMSSWERWLCDEVGCTHLSYLLHSICFKNNYILNFNELI